MLTYDLIYEAVYSEVLQSLYWDVSTKEMHNMFLKFWAMEDAKRVTILRTERNIGATEDTPFSWDSWGDSTV